MEEVAQTQDEINVIMMDIEDKTDQFDSKYQEIDKKYMDVMKSTGVNKLIEGYDFKEFHFALADRLDNLPDDKCPNCKKGLVCAEHL